MLVKRFLMLSEEIHDAPRPTSRPQSVDNTDWLKTVAIIMVLVGHFGYFFMEDDRWWGVFGRVAAPSFFFLMGYAHTRNVPFRWIWLGVGLTVLDSWNNGWTWMPPNILLSFALIRVARPYVQAFMKRYRWGAFAFLVAALLALLPVAREIVDYGSEGWLWALFGLCQRMYADRKSETGTENTAQSSPSEAYTSFDNASLMRLVACLVAAVVYIWQEQKEYEFSHVQLAAVVLGVGLLSTSLCLFRRGPSRIQPTPGIGGVLRFIGRHTLEIYAIELAGFELIVKFVPDLAP